MKNYRTILDVRTEMEYNDGHVENAVNIPLNEIQEKLEEIKTLQQPVLLCCQSGARSGVATAYLHQQGVECFNGGGWREVESAIENGDLCLAD